MNESSLFVRLVFQILGAQHPIRLSVGMSFGIILGMLLTSVAAGLPHPSLAELSAYPFWAFILACAPLTYLPLLAGKKGAPESVVHQINTVDALLERSGLSQESKKMVWRSLVGKYVEQAKPDFSGTPDLKELAELELENSKPGPEASA